MFKFLKEKLKAFKRKIDESLRREEAKVEKVEEVKGEEARVEAESRKEGKKVGLVDKIKTLIVEREILIDEKKVNEILEDLEIILLESDVAFEVVEAISDSLRSRLVGRKRKIGEKLSDIVLNELKMIIKVCLMSKIQNHYNNLMVMLGLLLIKNTYNLKQQ